VRLRHPYASSKLKFVSSGVGFADHRLGSYFGSSGDRWWSVASALIWCLCTGLAFNVDGNVVLPASETSDRRARTAGACRTFAPNSVDIGRSSRLRHGAGSPVADGFAAVHVARDSFARSSANLLWQSTKTSAHANLGAFADRELGCDGPPIPARSWRPTARGVNHFIEQHRDICRSNFPCSHTNLSPGGCRNLNHHSLHVSHPDQCVGNE